MTNPQDQALELLSYAQNLNAETDALIVLLEQGIAHSKTQEIPEYVKTQVEESQSHFIQILEAHKALNANLIEICFDQVDFLEKLAKDFKSQ